MKKLIVNPRLFSLLLLLSAGVFLSSCDDDDPVITPNPPAPTPTQSITDIVVEGANFSFLETAVTTAISPPH